MIVKLLGRFLKESSNQIIQDIEEELDTQELLKGDAFNYDLERGKLIAKHKAYDYSPIIFNLKDVALYNEVDAQHVSVKMYTGLSFTFKITFAHFTSVYEQFIGEPVRDCTQQPFNNILTQFKP